MRKRDCIACCPSPLGGGCASRGAYLSGLPNCGWPPLEVLDTREKIRLRPKMTLPGRVRGRSWACEQKFSFVLNPLKVSNKVAGLRTSPFSTPSMFCQLRDGPCRLGDSYPTSGFHRTTERLYGAAFHRRSHLHVVRTRYTRKFTWSTSDGLGFDVACERVRLWEIKTKWVAVRHPR